MKKYKIYKNKKDLVSDLIDREDTVLDVGFWGQGIKITDKKWPHRLILDRSKDVYGIDIDFDEGQIKDKQRYKKANAENFDFDVDFDTILAFDLIEHLSNQGLFLDACKRNLKNDGKLILTTPNCFGMFNLTAKLMNFEPTVNKDHTCYYNIKTIKALLKKNGFEVVSVGFVYTLGYDYKESIKKKFLNVLYYTLSKFTPKYIETLVIVARKHDR